MSQLKPHTKQQLDKLAPEYRMFKHAESLHLPECVMIELEEQKNFISDTKKIFMCSWFYDQFINWYERSM